MAHIDKCFCKSIRKLQSMVAQISAHMLQRDIQKDQHRIKELEKKTEQQAKVLKVKTEEVVAVQKRLRSANQMSR